MDIRTQKHLALQPNHKIILNIGLNEKRINY
jgi:hypothetical protein